MIDINVFIYVSVTLVILLGGAISVIVHLFKHPEKVEKWVALINKWIKGINRLAEYRFIKYDIQAKVNVFATDLFCRVPNLIPSRVKIEWIDTNQTKKEIIEGDTIILRMHKSDDQAKNVVNATFTFVSASLLRKAKRYIAPYQKESIDLFVSTKLFEKERVELMEHFIDEYLKDSLDKDKISDFYERYFDLDRAGIFYPVFITEMTFLGEKIFGKGINRQLIFEEVKSLVYFLTNYSNRLYRENIVTEFNGRYCKFSIRIIGKSFKVDMEGEKVYINNLKKIDIATETLYLLGPNRNRRFILSTVKKCRKIIGFDIFKEDKYESQIKDKTGGLRKVKTFLLILRNQQISLIHQ